MNRRLWFFASMLALALAVSGCGDDEPDGNGGTGGTGAIGGSGGDGGTGGSGGDGGTGGDGGSGGDGGTGGTGGEPLPEIVDLELVTPEECSPYCNQLFVGESIRLSVVGMDDDGNKYPVQVTWSSNDPEIASIDEEGVLVALAKGTTEISYRYEDLERSVEIYVESKPVDRIDLSVHTWEELLLAEGASVTIQAETYGTMGVGASVPVRAKVDFTIEDPAVATIEDKFLEGVMWHVTIRGEAEGTTNLVITSPQAPEELELRVRIRVRAYDQPAAEWQTDALAAGFFTNCALAAGKAYCWGEGIFGGLGNGRDEISAVPVPVAGEHVFVQIGTRESHVCALDDENRTWCWGNNFAGALGTPQSVLGYSNVPVEVASAPPFAKLRVGNNRACGLTSEGKAYCWGLNSHGQLGIGTTSDEQPEPTAVVGDHVFVDIVFGGNVTCGLDVQGKIWCWGERTSALGLGEDIPHVNPAPVQLDVPTTFKSITAGYFHVCALDVDGDLWCWGKGEYGQLGIPVSFDLYFPTKIEIDHTFVAIYAGGRHTCGIDQDGAAWCWGANESGQLGVGDSLSSTHPKAVMGDLTFAELALGSSTTCGRTTEGYTYCWGDGSAGRRGDGTSSHAYYPMPVTAPTTEDGGEP